MCDLSYSTQACRGASWKLPASEAEAELVNQRVSIVSESVDTFSRGDDVTDALLALRALHTQSCSQMLVKTLAQKACLASRPEV